MESIGQLDVGKLRAALCFIHCVQKERGATACATGEESSLLLLEARRETDRALRRLLRLDPHLLTERATLDKIRCLVHNPSFHRILACFTTLVQSVVHQFVLVHTAPARKRYERNNQWASTTAPPLPGDWNTGSHGALQGSMWNRSSVIHPTKKLSPTHVEKSHKRTSSNGAPFRPSSDPNWGSPVDFYKVQEIEIEDAEWRESKIDLFSEPPETLEPLVDHSSLRKAGQYSPHAAAKSPLVSFETKAEDDEDHILRLLTLLDTFVQLKESTGLERATLNGILVADQSDSLFMLNDLVLEVENQRQQIKILTSLLPKSGALHALVAELVSLSPKMKQLQSNILQGSDLNLLRLDFRSHKELWNLLTVYIDKLHALELMILEQIECCMVDYEDDAVLPIKRVDHEDKSTKTQEEKQAPPRSTSSGRTKDSETGMTALLEQLSTTATPSAEWGIDIYEIRFLRRIGEGSAGTTYLASWSGLDVAVKVAAINELGLDGWQTEVQTLQKLHHPNVIRLLGSVYRPQPPTFCLVLEYCDAGDLADALQKSTPTNFFFRVAIGVAKATHYLHHRGIVHRDIKPGNILLHGDVGGGRFEVKLTDFGMATEANRGMGERTGETGTYRWMAPEVIRHEPYGPSADVFSFAIVLWQLLTREHPYSDTESAIEAAAAVALEDKRPPIPKGTPNPIVDLLAGCWTRNATDRPHFDDIVSNLDDIEQNALTDKEKVWIGQPRGNPVYSKGWKKETKPPKLKGASPKKRPAGVRGLFQRKSVHF